MTLDEIGTRLEAARGRIDRIYCHWTGAPYQLVECLAYHVVIDRGGYCHVIHEDFTEWPGAYVAQEQPVDWCGAGVLP